LHSATIPIQGAKMDRKVEIRLGWIEACLRYGSGFDGDCKTLYQEKFCVSPGQTSRDQTRFINEMNSWARNALLENIKGKIILLHSLPEETRFPMPIHEDWLKEMMRTGYLNADILKHVAPPDHILRNVVTGIRRKKLVMVRYCSRKSDVAEEKLLSPHTLVNVVNRYHVRAFDHSDSRFKDFVLARMESCNPVDFSQKYVGIENDTEWSSYQTLTVQSKIIPPPRGVAMEFNLDESGKNTISARKAIIDYLSDDHEEAYSSPVVVSQNPS